MRTIESLYWLGVRAWHSKIQLSDGIQEFGQWDAYKLLDEIGLDNLPSAAKAIEVILDQITHDFTFTTKLFIVPSYPFQM